MGSPIMDLVERYIAAVKFWLPAHMRDDVAAELAEDIRCEIEEAERAKGRPLTEDEVAAILKARGAPLAVASRYQPQRHLVGPELFPLYIFVLKIVAAICIVPPVLAFLVRAVTNDHVNVPHLISSPINSLLLAFAIVTTVFALIEHNGIDVTKGDRWDPKALRPVIDRNRIARGDSIGEIVAALVGIGIFAAGYLSITTYEFSRGGSITVAPEWIPFWQVMVALTAADLAMAAYNLFRPYWTGPRVVIRLIIGLAETAAFCWLLQSHLIRDVTGVPEPFAAQVLHFSDKAAEFTQPIAGVVAAVLIVTALWRILRTTKLRRVAA